ncbi:hypothetical protein LCGC14_1888930 [marine sediment metagenome]|uniref:Uncharacterized protein n=1 Tax=marine sediment metagenome TaxID=412755 RepID=A0A0F9IY84_9ZZZZ
MKLPAGKTLVPEAVQKVRSAVFTAGSAILAADLGLTPEVLLQVARAVERAVEKELTALSLTDIPNYVAPPVDPNAPKVGRPKGSKAK